MLTINCYNTAHSFKYKGKILVEIEEESIFVRADWIERDGKNESNTRVVNVMDVFSTNDVQSIHWTKDQADPKI